MAVAWLVVLAGERESGVGLCLDGEMLQIYNPPPIPTPPLPRSSSVSVTAWDPLSHDKSYLGALGCRPQRLVPCH